MANEDTHRIEQKLDILIHLQLLAVAGRESPAVAERIAVLSDMGLAPAEIGRIIGKPANYVSAALGKRGRGSNGKSLKRKAGKQA